MGIDYVACSIEAGILGGSGGQAIVPLYEPRGISALQNRRLMIYDAAIVLYWVYVIFLIGGLYKLVASDSPRFVRCRAKVMAFNPQWWYLLGIWAALSLFWWVFCWFQLYALAAMCMLEAFVWFIAFVTGLVDFRKRYEADLAAKREARIQAMATSVDRSNLAVDALLAHPPERLRH